MKRSVQVVIVAFHAPAALDRCLTALEGLEPTVVDNSSSAAIADVCARRSAHYLDPGGNLGFAAGVNCALRPLLDGPPQDALLLNPDALLTPDQIDHLASFLAAPQHLRCAAVAPTLVDHDGRPERTFWPFPSPLRAWVEAIGLGRIPSRATFAVGAALLLRWEALRDVGLFDERFFLYAEETDWQRRARRQGWEIGHCPSAAGMHEGAGTSSDPTRREILFHAGQETYIRKWYGPLGWWIYRAAAVAGAAARAVVLRAERRRIAARRVVLYVRGPRRSAGFPRVV